MNIYRKPHAVCPQIPTCPEHIIKTHHTSLTIDFFIIICQCREVSLNQTSGDLSSKEYIRFSKVNASFCTNPLFDPVEELIIIEFIKRADER